MTEVPTAGCRLAELECCIGATGVMAVVISIQPCLTCCQTDTTRTCPGGMPAPVQCSTDVTTMSGPLGCTVTSPIEKSVIGADFQWFTQPSRSNAWPCPFTPTNVGASRSATACQSLSCIACHISRSYCSAPVAFFQVGCLGAPPMVHPAKQSTITTEDTEAQRGNQRIGPRLGNRSLERVITSSLPSLDPK
jgi:hypothetical protein